MKASQTLKLVAALATGFVLGLAFMPAYEQVRDKYRHVRHRKTA